MLRARKRLDYAGLCGCNDAGVRGRLKWFVDCKLKELCVESACVCASVCGCLDVVLSEAGYHAARGALMQCHLGI